MHSMDVTGHYNGFTLVFEEFMICFLVKETLNGLKSIVFSDFSGNTIISFFFVIRTASDTVSGAL